MDVYEGLNRTIYLFYKNDQIIVFSSDFIFWTKILACKIRMLIYYNPLKTV